MNYILTQKELDDLMSKEKHNKTLKINKYLEKLVLKHGSFKCIHKNKDGLGNIYCDRCPLSFVQNGNSPQDIQYDLCSEENQHFSK